MGLLLLLVGATTMFAEPKDALDRIWRLPGRPRQSGLADARSCPSDGVRHDHLAVGFLLAALLFTGGKYVIGAYIGHSGVASGFGAAGSLVVLLLWVYFSAQILLLGAEFTCVYARTFGSLSSAPPITATDSSNAAASTTPSASTG